MRFRWNQSVSSVAQLCPTVCNPMDCSTPDFPVHYQLLKLAQTHVNRVGDAIQHISFSVVPFSSCLQSFSASGSFPMSQFLLGWCPGICIWTNFQGIRGNTYVWDSLISWKWSLERVSCQSTELPSTSDYFKLNSNSNNYKSDTILGSGAMHACLVTQSYLTLCDPMNYSQPGSSVHGIFSRQEYWNG